MDGEKSLLKEARLYGTSGKTCQSDFLMGLAGKLLMSVPPILCLGNNFLIS